MTDANDPINEIYRRNPARDVETFAVQMVRHWLDDRGAVVDMSAGHEPDFRIDYSDGRTGWGEVGWHEDEELRAMWSLTFRQEKHQQVDLPSGVGTWVVSLVKGASIKRLKRELAAFVVEMTRAGCERLEVVEKWPHGLLGDTARRLGIEYINRMGEGTADVAVYFMPGSGGVVPTDPDVISEWASDVLADPDYADTTGKLLIREADERHVFLMSGSRTPFGVTERLRRLDEALPTRSPVAPDGITHVWVVSQYGNGTAGMWARTTGWSTVALPDSQS